MTPWRVLIVDDDADDRADIRRMLLCGSDRTYEFVDAGMGSDCVRLIREAAVPFDCVLLDFCLPDMDAMDVLRAVSNDAGDLPCAVMVITGSDRRIGQQLVHAGAQDYVGKSGLTPDHLTRGVENAVGRFALLTERIRAEQALRMSEERFRLSKQAALEESERQQRFMEGLTQVMPCTVHLYDLGKQHDIWVNRHIGSILGYSAQEIAQSGTEFLQMHMDAQEYRNLLRHFEHVAEAQDGEVVEFEYRVCRRDRQWRWFRNSDTIFRRDAEQRAVELVGTASDITERKLIEADLNRAVTSAENANRAKSDFLSSMSHELRSPLNAILGFAQLLDTGAPSLTPPQQDSVEQILKAGWYLLELINEVLDLSMIESGKLSLSTESLSLADVLRDCKAMIESQARSARIDMTFAEFDPSWRISADRVRVKQVFLNLLSNAIKYNRTGGSVRVVCQPAPGERIRISVEDTGAGLSPEKVANLFRPFERLGQESGTVEGTGVGLVVSKRLTQLMGGSIGVESVLGVGSAFWVELLAVTEPSLVSAGPVPIISGTPTNGAAAHTFTVLCVEDNAANMMLVERILARRADIKLLAARDGDRGVQIALQSKPDVVLMDINLPGISGLEALTVLSHDPSTAHIPVIALSANAMPRDIELGRRAGFFRYLTKPIEIEPFNNALDAALRFSRSENRHTREEASI